MGGGCQSLLITVKDRHGVSDSDKVSVGKVRNVLNRDEVVGNDIKKNEIVFGRFGGKGRFILSREVIERTKGLRKTVRPLLLILW